MALKYRLTWMKIHTYFACFFFPLSIIYIASGVLYLFDIKGENKAEYHYAIELPDGWPTDEESTKKLVLPLVAAHGHGKLPVDYYHDDEFIGWYGYKQQVFLDPRKKLAEAELTVIEHDFLQQCLLIHKGHAGILFWLFSIMLGGSLLLSVITGFVLAFSIPTLWRSSLLFSFLGLAAVVIGFFFSP